MYSVQTKPIAELYQTLSHKILTVQRIKNMASESRRFPGGIFWGMVKGGGGGGGMDWSTCRHKEAPTIYIYI